MTNTTSSRTSCPCPRYEVMRIYELDASSQLARFEMGGGYMHGTLLCATGTLARSVPESIFYTYKVAVLRCGWLDASP